MIFFLSFFLNILEVVSCVMCACCKKALVFIFVHIRLCYALSLSFCLSGGYGTLISAWIPFFSLASVLYGADVEMFADDLNHFPFFLLLIWAERAK